MKKLGGKEIVLLFQVIIILILAIFIVNCKKNEFEKIDLSTFSSEYIGFNGSDWHIDANSLSSDKERTLLYGPYIKIGRGSYSLNIKYTTNRYIECKIMSTSASSFVKAERFWLDPYKNSISYDFFVTNDVDDLEIRIIRYPADADFTLSSVGLKSTNNHLILLLVCLGFIFVIIDVLIFNIINIRENRCTIISILAVTFLASVPMLFPGLIKGDDFEFHIQRLESIAEGLKNGEFPVRIHSLFMEGYGYPTGVFYGDVFLYFPALLRVLGFTLNTSYKIFVCFINLFTSFTSYKFGKQVCGNKKGGIIVALLYVTSSYRLFDIFARSAVGEYTAMVFYPVVLLAVWNIYTRDITEKNYYNDAVCLAIGMSGLLYSHLLSTEIFVIILTVIACVMFNKTFRKRTILVYLQAILLTTVMGLAYIIPFLDYFFNTNTIIKARTENLPMIQNEGAYITDYFSFFKNCFGYSGEPLSYCRMQLTPGLVMMLALIIGIFLVLNKTATKRIKILTVGSLILLFMASNLFPWDTFALVSSIGRFMAQIQFPWRYLGIVILLLPLLTYEILQYLNQHSILTLNQGYCIVTILTFVSVAWMAGATLENSSGSTVYYDTAQLKMGCGEIGFGEYLLEETDIYDVSQNILAENTYIELIDRKSEIWSLYAEASNNATVEIPEYNYPYYVAEDSMGNELELYNGVNNRIGIKVPDFYVGEITIYFKEPVYWRIAEVLSGVSFLFLIIYSITVNVRQRKEVN